MDSPTIVKDDGGSVIEVASLYHDGSAQLHNLGSKEGPGDLDFMTSALNANDKLRLLDEQDLRAQGKTQDLTRRFTFATMLSLAIVEMGTWGGMLTLNSIQLASGGYPSLIWGFFFSWMGILMVTASLAELCSIAPVSAGQYHWVWMLAPKRSKKFLSWWTGIISTLAWTFAAASTLVAVAQFVLLIIEQAHTSWQPSPVMGRLYETLIAFALIIACFVINTRYLRFLPQFAVVMLFLTVAAFLGFVITFAVAAPKNPVKGIFSGLVDSAGWSTNGLAFMVGLLGSNLSMLGSDGPCHLVEEVKNAAVAVPRAMIWSVLISGFMGFSMCIIIAFVAVTDDQTSAYGYNFVAVFESFSGSRGATAALAVIIVLLSAASVAYMTTASRQARAFARDNGVPFSSYFRTVKDINGTKSPMRSSGLVSVCAALITLLNLASPAAVNAILSLVVTCLMLSIFFPILFMAWTRIKQQRGDNELNWGRWRMNLFGYHIPGMGLVVNILASCYLAISIAFSFFPTVLPVTLDTMNWAVLVFAGFFLISLVYWAMSARKIYRGVIHEKDVFAVQYHV